MLEHSTIILRYRKTGCLDRSYAIEKYKDFNIAHPEYIIDVNICGFGNHNVTALENMNDWDIVANLNRQLIYLRGKNLLEGLQNG